MGDGVLYRERIYLRRGPYGVTLPLAAAIYGLIALIPGLHWGVRVTCAGAAAVFLLVLVVGWIEVLVAPGGVTVSIGPLFRRHVDVADIERLEPVLADATRGLFGGWSASRQGLTGAIVAEVEGERRPGAYAVRITTSAGRTLQVYTWQPGTLMAAIERARSQR